MLSSSSISELPLSTYLEALLSGEAYELVLYMCDSLYFNVYTTVAHDNILYVGDENFTLFATDPSLMTVYVTESADYD